MKTMLLLAGALMAGLFLTDMPARAELDLDQEVLIIPDTHNEKPYVWHVARNPKGHDLLLSHNRTEGSFVLKIVRDRQDPLSDLHVFITDHDLHSFAHFRPEETSDGTFSFGFAPAKDGMYRFEVVFRADEGWVNLKKDLMLPGSGKENAPDDRGYSASVKSIPKNSYADHVTTFLYELAYNGEPVTDLEKIGGADMVLASWDEDLREFVFATPLQNLGGPKVAVSVVFGRAGRHAVFSEFRHRGATRTVESVTSVRMEPNADPYFIENLRPAD